MDGENINSFRSELIREIESSGVTAANIADIAKKHQLDDEGYLISIPGYKHLFIYWDIKEEAVQIIKDILNERDDFTVNVCNFAMLLLLCGYDGLKIPTMKIANKIYDYKTDHLLPIVIEKRRTA